MRFKEFINESSDINFEEAFEHIKKECKPFLSAYKENFLYRGMKGMHSVQVLEMPHRSYRAPKDSANWFNAFFNAGLDLAYGIENIRSRALFCIGNPSEAANFGSKFAIFPKGDIELVWAPTMQDSFMYDEDIIHDLIKDLLLNDSLRLAQIEPYATSIIDGFKELVSKDSSIIGATRRILTDDEDLEEIFKSEDLGAAPTADEIRDAMKTRFAELYDNSQRVDQAAKSGKEILLYQTDGFFAVSIDSLVRWSRATYENMEKYGDMTSEEMMSTLLGA